MYKTAALDSGSRTAPLATLIRKTYRLGRPIDGKILPPPLSKPIAAE